MTVVLVWMFEIRNGFFIVPPLEYSLLSSFFSVFILNVIILLTDEIKEYAKRFL